MVVATPTGVPKSGNFRGLVWLTCLFASVEFQRFSGQLANQLRKELLFPDARFVWQGVV